MALVILIIGFIFFASHSFTVIFERTRIPDVLLLIVIGIIVGPLLGIVEVNDFGKLGSILSTLALIVILFESGMQLNVSTIKKSIKSTLAITMLTFVASVLIISAIAYFVAGFSMISALILGSILGGTSSAVVIPLAKGLKMPPKSETILVLESAITDVLCIVLTISFIGAQLSDNIEPMKMVGYVLSSFLFASLIGLGGSIAWLLIHQFIRRFPNTFLSTLAFAFIIYGFTELLGFSGGIASLAFGFGLSNNERIVRLLKLRIMLKRDFSAISTIEKNFFSEVVFILKTFFFLFLGISIQFSSFSTAMISMFIVLAIYTMRLFMTRFTLNKSISVNEASIVSLMVPKGLAAAVLAGLPLQYGIAEGVVIQETAFLVVLFSIVLTALLIPFTGKGFIARFYQSFFRKFSAAGDKTIDHDTNTNNINN